jgi:Magnetochrome domain
MKFPAAFHPDGATWIMAAGIAFGVAMFLTATFSDDLWSDHTYGMAPPIIAGTVAPHSDGRQEMVCSSCHIVLPPQAGGGQPGGLLPIVKGGPVPHTDGREKLPCDSCHTIISKKAAGKAPPSLHPGINSRGIGSLPHAVTVAMTVEGGETVQLGEGHERFIPYRYQGRVRRVAGEGNQSLYVLVDDGINPPSWIDLAPRWFLRAAECPVREGVFIKGTAYHDPVTEGETLLYAQTLMVNGEVCTLRDSHLSGLWAVAGGADVDEK